MLVHLHGLTYLYNKPFKNMNNDVVHFSHRVTVWSGDAYKCLKVLPVIERNNSGRQLFYLTSLSIPAQKSITTSVL